MYRYQYNILLLDTTDINNKIGRKGFFEFNIISKKTTEEGLLIIGIVSYSRENLEEHEVIDQISNYMKSNIKLVSKEDMFDSINNKVFYHGTTKVFYHGTTEESFKGLNNYIYLSLDLSHAISHAKYRAKENNEKALVVKININNLYHCDFLPDNDIDGSNGYLTVLESYNDIGTILVIGNISSDLFEKVLFK